MPDSVRRVIALALHADAQEWRGHARTLLADGIAPENVDWLGPDERGLFEISTTDDLFSAPASTSPSPRRRPGPSDVARPEPATTHRVPRSFVDALPWLLSHSHPQRFGLAYRLLWRIVHGEPRLLERITDPDVFRVRDMHSAVRRDHHKMKAFVRFREIDAGDGGTAFIAWFEPEHFIVDLASTFFAKRFASMRWSILTPYRSVHWDGAALQFAPGAARSDAPDDDRLEALWRTYYANIFNPARLKIDAMQREMPVKYWKNLPEAHLIGALVRDASKRMESMVASAPTRPRKQFPHPRRCPCRWPRTISMRCASRHASVAPVRCGSRPRRPSLAKARTTRRPCSSVSSRATRKTSQDGRSSAPRERCSIAHCANWASSASRSTSPMR
jgi:probable DNA metabolism protein